MRARFIWRSGLVSIVAACQQSTAVGPESLRLDVGGPGPVVASASGGIQRIRGDDLWVMGFNAVRHADGSATGNYHVDRQDLGIKFDVDVTCLSVVGDTAWIGGVIRKVDGPVVIEGTVSYFFVVDKGEGSDAPVDVASAIRINDVAGQDLVFCRDRPVQLSRGPIDFGNLQVRSF